jgi:hypothetical protein
MLCILDYLILLTTSNDFDADFTHFAFLFHRIDSLEGVWCRRVQNDVAERKCYTVL